MRYLIINEFGDVSKTDNLTQRDLEASEKGLVTLIHVENLQLMSSDGAWTDIENWEYSKNID